MITITPKAIDKVMGFRQSDPRFAGKAFRVYVEGGGCSGMSYGFRFDDRHADDTVLSLDGLELVVDPKSLQFIHGSEVDYVQGFEGSGFTVRNPQAKGTCGCGQSFNT